jgi:hypothetical protein
MNTEKLSQLEVRITEKYGTILNKFRILNHNWEMDGYGYVVDAGAERKIIATNHNRPVEVGTEFLNYKIKEYEDAIKESKDIIEIVQNGKYKI